MSAPDWAEILTRAAAQLDAAGVPGAMRDARRLLAHCLGVEAARVTLITKDRPGPGELARFQTLIMRRETREPLSHITGTREFYGHHFLVTSDVLDPRPETEHLVALALEEPFSRVLDLGTGSGCILLSLLAERPDATGVGSDVSGKALQIARENTDRLALGSVAEFQVSDWFGTLSGSFDLIVANPPYISASEMGDLAPEVAAFEPAMALTPGGDGLDAYRAICAGFAPFLRPSGRLIVEIGPTQARDVRVMFERAGLEQVRVLPDYDGRDRLVTGRMQGNRAP